MTDLRAKRDRARVIRRAIAAAMMLVFSVAAIAGTGWLVVACVTTPGGGEAISQSSAALNWTCANGAPANCPAASQSCAGGAGAVCVANVRDFGAVGDGVTDDTNAIQCAINAASNYDSGTGGAVYLPRGKYKISLQGSCASDGGRGGVLAIRSSNIRMFGDGNSSILYAAETSDAGAPTWGVWTAPVIDNSVIAYLMVGDDTKTISNVALEDFQFLGPFDAGSLGPYNQLSAIGLGTPAGTNVVHYSGTRGMHFEGAGRFGGVSLNGGQNPGAGDAQAIGNYAMDNRFYNIAGHGVDPASGANVDTIARGNQFSQIGVGGPPFEWASARALIQDNVITNAQGGGIIFSQEGSQLGWTIASGNLIAGVGYAGGSNGCGQGAPNAIQLSEGDRALHVRTAGNAISGANGCGIVANAGASDLVIEQNTVDGFGLSGGSGYLGVTLTSGVPSMSRVAGNFARCTVAGSACQTGIATGGTAAQNGWSDRNIVTGVTNLSNVIGPSAGALSMPSSAGVHGAGSDTWLGRNVDIDTGAATPHRNNGNNIAIPVLDETTGGTLTKSVGGSLTWQVRESSNTTLASLPNGTIGETVRLLFAGAGITTVTDNGSSGTFDLSGDFHSSATVCTTLVLLCTSNSPERWVEVSRSQLDRSCP